MLNLSVISYFKEKKKLLTKKSDQVNKGHGGHFQVQNGAEILWMACEDSTKVVQGFQREEDQEVEAVVLRGARCRLVREQNLCVVRIGRGSSLEFKIVIILISLFRPFKFNTTTLNRTIF